MGDSRASRSIRRRRGDTASRSPPAGSPPAARDCGGPGAREFAAAVRAPVVGEAPSPASTKDSDAVVTSNASGGGSERGMAGNPLRGGATEESRRSWRIARHGADRSTLSHSGASSSWGTLIPGDPHPGELHASSPPLVGGDDRGSAGQGASFDFPARRLRLPTAACVAPGGTVWRRPGTWNASPGAAAARDRASEEQKLPPTSP